MLDDASYQYFMEFYLLDLIPCNYVKYNHLGMLKCVSVGFNSVIKQKNMSLPSKYIMQRNLIISRMDKLSLLVLTTRDAFIVSTNIFLDILI